MKKRTIGVIGVGNIGGRHARNLKNLGNDIVVYDPARPSTVLNKVLDEADAFVVASPINTHYWYANACSEKPTFMEKPISDAIDDNLTTTNVLMVGYNLRFHSCVLKAKEWLDAGMIGRPIWANLVCAEKKKNPKDHVILNWSHEIDLALHLLGTGNVVACAAADDLADIVIQHKLSGCQSTIHLDYLTEPDIRQTLIVGNKATIIMDLVNRYAWLRDASGTMLDQFQGQDSFDSNYADEIETFLARADGTETIGATAAEGLEVLRICLDAQKKAA